MFDERAIAVTDKLVKGRVYLEGKLSLNEVLREVYNDPAASPAHRIKAAGLALPHEVPRLESVPPPLELVAEPVEPLAEVVRRQRARADRMLLEDPQFRGLRNSGYLLKSNNSDGNGSDDQS